MTNVQDLSQAQQPSLLVARLPELALLALGILVVSLFWRVYTAFFSPLASIPGPFLAKFTRLWQIWRYYKGQWHDDIEWLHETYGPVVRIAPDEVSFVDHDALRKLYSHANAAPKVGP
jgi:hypothetical protein